jgi:uncharacterized small protein (DUF1192 family)
VGPVDEDAKWLRTLKLRDIADRLESQQAEIERLREALHRKQQTWGAD